MSPSPPGPCVPKLEVELAERTGGSRGHDPSSLTGPCTAAEWVPLCDLPLSPYPSVLQDADHQPQELTVSLGPRYRDYWILMSQVGDVVIDL